MISADNRGKKGYTGLLTAEQIAENLPVDLKWALAGRTESKLQHVIDECNKINSDRVQPGKESGTICVRSSIRRRFSDGRGS